MSRTRSDRDLLIWSHILLLVGGIMIIVGGLWMALFIGTGPGWGMMGWMMSGTAFGGSASGFAGFLWVWAIASGSLALLAGINVRADRNPTTWGTLGIVAGAASFLVMGVAVLGAIAAIAGGALAVLADQRGQGARPS